MKRQRVKKRESGVLEYRKEEGIYWMKRKTGKWIPIVSDKTVESEACRDCIIIANCRTKFFPDYDIPDEKCCGRFCEEWIRQKEAQLAKLKEEPGCERTFPPTENIIREEYELIRRTYPQKSPSKKTKKKQN
jgi:hypothetical protein